MQHNKERRSASMNIDALLTSDGHYELHIVNDVLYITSEQDKDVQIVLSKNAQQELVRSILEHTA